MTVPAKTIKLILPADEINAESAGIFRQAVKNTAEVSAARIPENKRFSSDWFMVNPPLMVINVNRQLFRTAHLLDRKSRSRIIGCSSDVEISAESNLQASLTQLSAPIPPPS